MKKIISLSFLTFFSFTILNAQRGKDGAKTVTATEVVNAYTSLTANANTGNTFISVTNSSLSNNFSGNLSAGDLIMIIQVQGVSVEDTVSSGSVFDDSRFHSTWGRILNYNNCGNYEFIQVESIPNSTTINLDCPLSFDYTSSGNVVVIRVPRYTDLTVNNGGILTADTWNGTTGGILAIEVNGITAINTGGAIDVSSLGFRGGQPEINSVFGGNRFASTNSGEGGEKGEGIVGDWIFYDSNLHGRYCRGAAANAGGGGTAHNAGGGGGSNAGNPLNWSEGAGVSDPTYNAAWGLESPSLVGANNSGGGRGGYSHTSSDENELTQGPGNAAWGGDSRRQMGGLGGRPLDYSTGKIFMGGAGGAGDGNSNPTEAGAGGNGAGIIFISSYGNVTGAGNITANGQNGGNSGTTAGAPFNTVTGKDAGGGAGAGGTIIIKTTGTVSGITIDVNGGEGGDQIMIEGLFANIGEAEGPGGGGGGGYIAITSGTPTRNATGGVNGTTDSPFISNFPPNGATSGGVGMPNESIPTFDVSVNNDVICENTTSTLTATINGTAPIGATIEWYDAATGGNLVFTGNPFTTPSLTTTTTYFIRVCPAPYRVPVTVTVNTCSAISASFSSTDSTLCATDCINFTDLSSGGTATSWSWIFQGANTTTSTQQNPTNICYNSAGNFNVSLVVSDGVNSDSLYMANFITVTALPNSGADGTATLCANATPINLFDSLGGNPDTGGTWSGPSAL
ncbi:MAG: PKD domain-containing protein, partial [Flavobacteriales bacterium]|nr:PKD domain-containing protein [Flavobacteriales bacterium]